MKCHLCGNHEEFLEDELCHSCTIICNKCVENDEDIDRLAEIEDEIKFYSQESDGTLAC